MNDIKIITHAATHHADEILAIATIFKFKGELPVERKFRIDKEELDNPGIIVLDMGGRLEPEKGNFDHHQNEDISATNILVLDYFCKDEKLKGLLKKNLYSYVDAVDRGIFPEPMSEGYITPSYNTIIRSLNNIDHGFEKAIEISRTILAAAVATACKAIKGEEIWDRLEKEGKIAIQHTNDQIVDWHSLAERDGILILITPNDRIPGAYQIMSRDTNLFKIPESDEQVFHHLNGFLAVYPEFKSALDHARSIITEYGFNS